MLKLYGRRAFSNFSDGNNLYNLANDKVDRNTGLNKIDFWRSGDEVYNRETV